MKITTKSLLNLISLSINYLIKIPIDLENSDGL